MADFISSTDRPVFLAICGRRFIATSRRWRETIWVSSETSRPAAASARSWMSRHSARSLAPTPVGSSCWIRRSASVSASIVTGSFVRWGNSSRSVRR